MKHNRLKIFPSLLSLFSWGSTMGQSVGIGTTTPAPSAIVDIKSTSKGVLVPRLADVQMMNISNPTTGLLVYNNTKGNFFYYGGTSWRALNLNLPDTITLNINGGAMAFNNGHTSTTEPTVKIINAGGGGIIGNSGGGGIAVFGLNNNNGKGVSGLNTNAGHGVHARGANGSAAYAEILPNGTGTAARFKQTNMDGKALVCEGNLKLSGGRMQPGINRVLTSDARGNATWQTAPYTAPRHGFEARGVAGNGANVQNRAVWFKFHFGFEKYDANGDYRLYNQVPSSTFVVPRAGMYDINSMIKFPGGDYDDCRVRIVVERNGLKTILAAKEITYEPGEFQHFQQSIKLSTTAKLNPADLVYVEVYQYSDLAHITFPLYESEKDHYFTMALIDDL